MNRYFIFTVDTEGDNLWAWKEGMPITTENSKYLPEFQKLCNKYNVKPVYLTNYEMLQDIECIRFLKDTEKADLCEIGMHIHAWNTPPNYELKNIYGGNAYITEYPEDIMREKAQFLKNELEKVFETKIISHRSGRWATNEKYLKVLSELGIKIDCSYTPGIDLSTIPGCSQNIGNNYKNSPVSPFKITDELYEIPMTTRRVHFTSVGSFKHKIKTLISGKSSWCRPLDKSLDSLIRLEKLISREKECNYVQMMIHSSELMPGGSPFFKTKEDVAFLYETLDEFFSYLQQKGYQPVTFKEYYQTLS